jgi:type IV pilus assembly protein PilB
MAGEHKRLGDLLIQAEMITPDQLDAAIQEHKKTGHLLGATLVRMGFVTERQVLQLLHEQLNLPLVDLDTTTADEQALSKIKEEQAKKYMALPIEIEGRKTLVVAMADPLNVSALEDLRFHAGMFIRPVLAAGSDRALLPHRHLDE